MLNISESTHSQLQLTREMLKILESQWKEECICVSKVNLNAMPFTFVEVDNFNVDLTGWQRDDLNEGAFRSDALNGSEPH